MPRSVIVLAFLLAGFAGGLASGRMLSVDRDQQPDATAPASAGTEPVTIAQRPGTPAALPDLTAVAERAVQASVNIASTQRVRVDPFFQMFGGGEPYRPLMLRPNGVQGGLP